jgi:glucose-1-phosphate thymidylyltransferase
VAIDGAHVGTVKAVVLARGVGRRMREAATDAPLTEAQRQVAASGRKGMMPVGDANGRPFLDHVLSSLADAGCTDICLVVAPDHDLIRTHYRAAGVSRFRLHYAVQPEPLGTANALLAARAFAADDPLLVLNADNLYPVQALRDLLALDGPGAAAFERAALVEESGFPAERVAQFAVLESDADGWLADVHEKPGSAGLDAFGPNALVSMNLWRFDAGIFTACQDVPRSARGEFELPEAVRLAVSRGARFRVVPARGAVLDLSRQSDIAAVGARLAGRSPRL